MALSYDDFRNILTGQEKKITTRVMVGGGGEWGGLGGRRSQGSKEGVVGEWEGGGVRGVWREWGGVRGGSHVNEDHT